MKKLSLLFAACVMSVALFAAPKVALISQYANVDAIVDDDEKAAATWFVDVYGGEFLPAQSIYAAGDLADFEAIWVMIDRTAIGIGVDKLPAEVTTIMKHVKTFLDNGGNVFLSNHATQYVAELGVLPVELLPGIFGDGEGGEGSDNWVLQPVIGNVEGQIYDYSQHAIYKGLAYENYNEWTHKTYALIGPGIREDHNCMWDLNKAEYGLTENPNKVADFQTKYNCKVLATWGHVVDYCCAGIVEFPGDGARGTVIANGLAAYEWNQNNDLNIYQGNIELLTSNILNYLAPNSTDLSFAEELHMSAVVNGDQLTIVNAPADMQATIYSLNGQAVATFSGANTSINNLAAGMYLIQMQLGGRTANMKFVK